MLLIRQICREDNGLFRCTKVCAVRDLPAVPRVCKKIFLRFGGLAA